jgi:hypothetical protein
MSDNKFTLDEGKKMVEYVSYNKGEGTPRKLATATQPQFPRKVADFKQANGFQISRRTLRKLMFE